MKDAIKSSFKRSRMVEEEAELWADGYVQALCIYPDFDSDRHIYRTYPVLVETKIREKLKQIIDENLIDFEFPIYILSDTE